MGHDDDKITGVVNPVTCQATSCSTDKTAPAGLTVPAFNFFTTTKLVPHGNENIVNQATYKTKSSSSNKIVPAGYCVPPTMASSTACNELSNRSQQSLTSTTKTLFPVSAKKDSQSSTSATPGGSHMDKNVRTPYPDSAKFDSMPAVPQCKDESYEELRFADHSQRNPSMSTAIPSKNCEFGAPAAVTPITVGPFGTTSPLSNIFGSTTDSFGKTSATVTPYQETNCQDGTKSVKLLAISAMPQFIDCSHEELRFADHTQRNPSTTVIIPPTNCEFGARAFAPVTGQPFRTTAPTSNIFVPTTGSFDWFLPTIFQETNCPNGTISLKAHQSISAMPQFKDCSHEELRFAYHSQRNQSRTAIIPSTNCDFGARAVAPIAGEFFGTNAAPANISGSTSFCRLDATVTACSTSKAVPSGEFGPAFTNSGFSIGKNLTADGRSGSKNVLRTRRTQAISHSNSSRSSGLIGAPSPSSLFGSHPATATTPIGHSDGSSTPHSSSGCQPMGLLANDPVPRQVLAPGLFARMKKLEKEHQFQPSGTKVTLVDTLEQLEWLKSIFPFFRSNEFITAETVVALDFTGTPANISDIQVTTKEKTFVFDCVALEAIDVCNFLRPILADTKVVKLIHDLHKAAAALKCVGKIDKLQGMFDTQLVMETETGSLHSSVHQVLQKFKVTTNCTGSSPWLAVGQRNEGGWIMNGAGKLVTSSDFIAKRKHALLLLEAFYNILNQFDEGKMMSIQNASDTRACYAAQTGGEKHVCFDSTKSYVLSSFELLNEMQPNCILQPSAPVVINDVSPLIALLPNDLAPWITKKADNLFEIVLDKGRPPIAWIGKKRMTIGGNDTTRLVSASDIAHIVDQLGPFGSDNRAGLERQLHRIAAIRNRNDDITGLTMRVGRHVSGNAYIISDLLYAHPNSSILFLGEPGSGKTTVVREVTRLLADLYNVCIVDTSNEIAGDGDIPHPCVGHARRMMVPTLDKQSAVMVECVQNHTPEVIVIDEIGRITEVEAARTCKNRGVRLIASAHGDLRQLVKNPKLRGLVGGTQSVTISDALARSEATKNGNSIQKTKSERAGPPTFEIVVELKRGTNHEWNIIFDSGKAVDRILEGKEYPIQRRTRNPTTGAMNVVSDTA
jgi:stage III sporulation protein SpoIIIAA